MEFVLLFFNVLVVFYVLFFVWEVKKHSNLNREAIEELGKLLNREVTFYNYTKEAELYNLSHPKNDLATRENVKYLEDALDSNRKAILAVCKFVGVELNNKITPAKDEIVAKKIKKSKKTKK